MRKKSQWQLFEIIKDALKVKNPLDRILFSAYNPYLT